MGMGSLVIGSEVLFQKINPFKSVSFLDTLFFNIFVITSRRRAMKGLFTILFLLVFGIVQAQEGSPKAIRGGTFNYNLSSAPKTLNPLSSTDVYATLVNGFMVESLATRNMDTYEWEPALATAWEVSKDGKTFTFQLRKGVQWHDGKELTAKDVKFSFDALTDPQNRYKTAHVRPYYEGIAGAKILDSHKIQFTTRTQYFGNFNVVAGLDIVPEHIYKDTSKKNIRKLKKQTWGTGPYKFKQLRRGKYLEVVANPDWWGRKDPSQKGQFNFDKIRFRFVQEQEMALRRLERGELDFLGLRAEDYYKKTKGPKWGKSVFKVRFENSASKGYGFIGFNLNHKFLKNKNIRRALYHLLDREKMIKKFLYGNAVPAIGPWYSRSAYADSTLKPIAYNPSVAKSLLKKEGWIDSDGDKILDKMIDGAKTKLSFTILEPREEFMKYLTLFKEEAKKSGVEVLIKRIDWSSFLKLIDEKKFEAVRLGWSGGSIDVDPKQIWHSSSSSAGGSNFISYNNPEVDRLIDEGRKIYDKEKRIKIFKKVYRMIAEDIPYLFFFNNKADFYGHTVRTKRVVDTYNYAIGFGSHWWLTP